MMRIQAIWRYPVKSMAGERLERACVSSSGIEGDRIVQVRNGRGRVVTCRTDPALLGHHSHLVRDDGSERFDLLPRLVATDGAIAAFGRDEAAPSQPRHWWSTGPRRAHLARVDHPHWGSADCRGGPARASCDDDIRPGYSCARSRGAAGHRQALRRKTCPELSTSEGGESFTISNRWISPGRDPTGCVGKVTGLAPCLTVNPVIRRYFSLRPEFGKQIASL